MSCEHKCFEQWDVEGPYECTMCGRGVVACIDDLRTRLATAERELSECLSGQASLIDANAELGRQRDDAIAACQQKHGVHPSWVNAVEKIRKERDEAREKLKVALRMLEVHARAGCPQADEDAARIRGDK